MYITHAGVDTSPSVASSHRNASAALVVPSSINFHETSPYFLPPERETRSLLVSYFSNTGVLFPYLHLESFLQTYTDVLQKRPTTPTLKRYTIDYLKTHTKSFDYTLSVLESLESQIREEIVRLGGNSGLEKIVDYLSVRDLREPA